MGRDGGIGPTPPSKSPGDAPVETFLRKVAYKQTFKGEAAHKETFVGKKQTKRHSWVGSLRCNIHWEGSTQTDILGEGSTGGNFYWESTIYEMVINTVIVQCTEYLR